MALFVLAVNKGLCATFRTVLKIVALVDEQSVDAKFLKGHGFVLGALVIELKLNDQSTKDETVTFEELGIDRLFIDESHNFKNRAKRCA